MMKIPMSSPDLPDAERQAVMEVINTPILSLGQREVEFDLLTGNINPDLVAQALLCSGVMTREQVDYVCDVLKQEIER